MTSESDIAETFLSCVPPDSTVSWVEHSNLADALTEFVVCGRSAWPEFELSTTAVVRYLAERAPTSGAAADTLKRLDAREIYLLCGCSLGLADALAAFVRDYLIEVDRTLPHMGVPPDTIAEIRQSISVRLLVAKPGERPLIDQYVGRGDLRGLIRVAARREAIDHLRKRRREVGADDELLQFPQDDPDPELECIKQQHRIELSTAMKSALSVLEPRERTLLRLHLLERLTVQQIATCYNVHRTTATRWLSNARASVLVATRHALRGRIDDSDMVGVVDLVSSRLDLSLERLLATGSV